MRTSAARPSASAEAAAERTGSARAVQVEPGLLEHELERPRSGGSRATIGLQPSTAVGFAAEQRAWRPRRSAVAPNSRSCRQRGRLPSPLLPELQDAGRGRWCRASPPGRPGARPPRRPHAIARAGSTIVGSRSAAPAMSRLANSMARQVDAVGLEPVGATWAGCRWPGTGPSTLSPSPMPSRSNMKMSCMVITSPSMPTISEICVTLRVPSPRRLTWITTLMALAICCRIAFSGRSRLAMEIMVSSRLSASRGVLAWSVVSEPSWPVFIACSMSTASAPRTSPMMIRSGRMRSALTSSMPLRHLARALDVGRAGLQPDHVRLAQLELGRVLDGDDPLGGRDERGQDVEQRRLAGAGAAGDQDVEPRPGRSPLRSSSIGSVRLSVPQQVFAASARRA